MIAKFISLTERRTKATVLINVSLITSIKDLRTDPACTDDFHYTVVRCGNDVSEVKETIQEISKLLADNAIADFTPKNEDLLYETIADIAFNFGWEHHDIIDSRELVSCIITWAKEFEQLHRNTEWGETVDYLEAIDSFSSDKIAEYLLEKR